MVAHYADDPWFEVVTVGGLPADEVISSLQKSIRRGDVENATLCAYQLAHTSEMLEEHLWKRLTVIAVEDVGPADHNCVIEVEAMGQARERFGYNEPDRFLITVAATRRLAEATKDRSNDELFNVVRLESDRGAMPAVHDWMLDMHTRRGQEMGRAIEHFLLECAQVNNESTEKDTTWHSRLFDLLGIKDDGD